MSERKRFEPTDRDVAFFGAGVAVAAVEFGYLPWWGGLIVFGGGTLLGLGVTRLANALQALVNRKPLPPK